jgi:hypothetical protein
MKLFLFLLVAAFVSSAYADEGAYSCTNGGGRGRTQFLITVDDDPGVSKREVHMLEKSYKTGDFRGWTFAGKFDLATAIETGDMAWSKTDRKKIDWTKVDAKECFVPVTTSNYSFNAAGDQLEITNIRDYQRRPTLKCRDRRPIRVEPGRAFYKCAETNIVL